ncbi:MAG: C40 family peptidase [Bacteroidales bacterium]|nr:C40 family peptidase [Bacteroidales bacterium]
MDEFGFCHLTCVPVRAEANDRSEMVNQLLFGETFEIVDAYGSWKVIRGGLDKYEGFIDQKQFLDISEAHYTELRHRNDRFPQKVFSMVHHESGSGTWVMPASSMGGFENGVLKIAGQQFTYADPLTDPLYSGSGNSVVDAAKRFMNAPYLWGGRSITGIDCSGLVQNAFKMIGVKLHRDASYQARQGETLSFISEAKSGDLAFFDNDQGEIIHVGIIADSNKIIHASGWVRMDEIDHNGIYNNRLKKYTHKLRLIKRII